MNIVLLFLIVASLSLDGVLNKVYNKNTKNKGAFIFCAMSTAAGCLYFLLSSGGNLSFEVSMLPYVYIFAFSYAATVISSYMAILTGPLSLSSLATSYSLIIPTLFGLFYYNEKSSIFFLVGILFMAASIFLINWAKDERKITAKWTVYAFCAFLFNGICSTTQTMQQRAFGGLYKNEFMIISLAIAVAAILCAALKTEKENFAECVKKGALLAITKGISNGFMNFLVMVLALRMAASLMFPLVSVGSVLLSTAIAAFFYKERLSLMQSIGLVLGLFAIVFLNI